jgi:hypothetical protein
MNGSWCPWSVPLYKGFRNRPYSLRCGLIVSYRIFPPFKCLSTGHSSNGFVTQLTDVLHAGSLVSCHNFLSLCLCFSKRSNPGRSLFKSERVTFLFDRLNAEATEAVKSLLPRVNFDSR